MENISSHAVVLIGKFLGNANRESEADVDAAISEVRVLGFANLRKKESFLRSRR